MTLTPEQTTEQFISFVRGEVTPTPPFTPFQHTFWRTEMSALFGDQEMVRLIGDVKFEGVPNIEGLLKEACRTSGVTGMKAEFLYNLFHNTGAARIGGDGMKVILEGIIDFQPHQEIHK